MRLVGTFAVLCNSEYEYSKRSNSVSAGMSAVAQGMQCPALPASMITPNESRLNAYAEALDVTSPCNLRL